MLYYIPLYYAVSKGLGALQLTVRLVPLTLPFIATIIITAVYLSRVNYHSLIYFTGSAIALGLTIALATALALDVSESKIMGVTVLGPWNLDYTFSTRKNIRDLIEGFALLNMSLMGGIIMALIIEAAVYEKSPMYLPKSALGSFEYKYDKGDLYKALSGVSQDTRGGFEANVMIVYGTIIVCKAIVLLFYIVASSSRLNLGCGVLAIPYRSRASGESQVKIR
ncbi:hypothetical protein FVER53590_25874 [Fusarium verticillioides]|nr:hypothetical protein FVER53590_25874 [Fusarium verticillioides]